MTKAQSIGNPELKAGIAAGLPPRTALDSLPCERLEEMLEAGLDVLECERVLERTGDNVVAELLRDAGTFYQWQHYPKGDIIDRATGSQFYYHAHPKESRPGEHGHFHTFMRASGMAAGVEPAPNTGTKPWPEGEKALSHLVAISMNGKGKAIALFTVNRWVTGETWYRADDILGMIDDFIVDHARPSWPVNRWVSGMFRLYRPLMHDLVKERDAALDAWRAARPDADPLEDHGLEIVSDCAVDVGMQVAALRRLVG